MWTRHDIKAQHPVNLTFVASLLKKVNGGVAADAPRRGNGAADNHPLAVRRFAPANQRMERTSVEASKLAPPSTAHPQPR
jgi:hypothetical protein